MDGNPDQALDESGGAAPSRRGNRPSPGWWLLALPILDFAGLLAPLLRISPSVLAAILIFSLGYWMLRKRP